MVVRVVWFAAEGEKTAFWLEQLRYAGVISWHVRGEQTPDPSRSGVYQYKHVFDIHPPRGLDVRAWARQNADRMRSFGINAQAVKKGL